MGDKLTAIKIKYNEDSYSDQIPISALAQNVIWDSNNNLVSIIGENANSGIRGNITSLQGRATSLEGSVNTLNGSVSNLQTSVSGLQTGLTQLDEEVNQLERIPSYTSLDANKVLTVNNTGENVVWKTLDKELPNHTSSDAGKVLTINNTGNTIWAIKNSEIPPYQGQSDKILAVNSTGTNIYWKTPNQIPVYPGDDEEEIKKYMLSGKLKPNTSDVWELDWKETFPDWHPNDVGKVPTLVMTTSYVEGFHIRWENKGVPYHDSSAYAGKILRVSNTRTQAGDNIEGHIENRYQLVWDNLSSLTESLPNHSSSTDLGKILKISTTSGNPIWVEGDFLPDYDPYTDQDKILKITTTNGETIPAWVANEGSLPETSSSSIGMVLSVVECNYEPQIQWERVIPEVSECSIGMVLSVNDSAELEWKGVFPTYDYSMEGQTISIASDGSLEWVDMLPSHSSLDEDKMLSVDSYGNLQWVEGIPYHSSGNQYQVLTVNSTGNLVWRAGIPPYTSSGYSMIGKVLLITNNGIPGWGDILPSISSGQPGYILAINQNGDGLEWIDPNNQT